MNKERPRQMMITFALSKKKASSIKTMGGDPEKNMILGKLVLFAICTEPKVYWLPSVGPSNYVLLLVLAYVMNNSDQRSLRTAKLFCSRALICLWLRIAKGRSRLNKILQPGTKQPAVTLYG
jgi:hypothetical protein